MDINTLETIRLDNEIYMISHGLYKLGGTVYSVNGLGIFSTTQFRTTQLHDYQSVVSKCAEDDLVNTIEVRGLVRTVGLLARV